MSEVTVGNYVFFIDDDDLPLFNKYSWKIHRNRGEPAYLSTTVMFHRLVVDAPRGAVVDHINNDGMDNRKSNLRITNHAENMRNKIPANRRREIATAHLSKG